MGIRDWEEEAERPHNEKARNYIRSRGTEGLDMSLKELEALWREIDEGHDKREREEMRRSVICSIRAVEESDGVGFSIQSVVPPRTIKIPFKWDIENIPKLPQQVRGYCYTLMFWTPWRPPVSREVGRIRRDYQWLDLNVLCPDCQPPITVDGPYRDLEEWAPPPDVAGRAQEAGEIITRRRELYYQDTHLRVLIEQELPRKVPRMPRPSNYKLLNENCPNCGERSVICCHHAERIGEEDFYDYFCHFCLNSGCNYGVYERIESMYCPFCRRDVYSDN